MFAGTGSSLRPLLNRGAFGIHTGSSPLSSKMTDLVIMLQINN